MMSFSFQNIICKGHHTGSMRGRDVILFDVVRAMFCLTGVLGVNIVIESKSGMRRSGE